MIARAAQGLGLPGVRYEKGKLPTAVGMADARRVENLRSERRKIIEDKSLTQKQKAEQIKPIDAQLSSLESQRGAAIRAEALSSAERAQQVREETEASRKAKEAAQIELEQRVLDLGTELADKEGQLARAKTDASKERLRSEIEDINKETQLAQAQLDALGEAKPRRKGPATAPSTSALSKQKPLRTGTQEAAVAESHARERAREEIGRAHV